MNIWTNKSPRQCFAQNLPGSTPTWTNPAYVALDDTNYAAISIPAAGTSGLIECYGWFYGTRDSLGNLPIPPTAEILGIQVDVTHMQNTSVCDNNVQLRKDDGTGNAGNAVGQNKATTQPWLAGNNNKVTYGGPSDLWGTTWTYAEIIAFHFGLQISAKNNDGSNAQVAGIQYIVMNIYWRTKKTDVPKRYRIRVFNRTGLYLGRMPDTSTVYNHSQEINTAGGQIVFDVPVSIDTASNQSAGTIQDETGADITDELSNALLTEGATPVIALGTGAALIKNGNKIQVTEFSSWYPNGRLMFIGTIEKWQAAIGTGDSIEVTAYSDGSELDNFPLYGAPYTYTLDQQQTTFTQQTNISTTDAVVHDWFGQTFTVGAGQNNVGAISVWLYGTAHVTLTLYSSPIATNQLASYRSLISSANGETLITLPNHIPATPGQQMFFTLTVDVGESIGVGYSNTGASTYAGGDWYRNYSATSYAWAANNTVDLCFKTWSTVGQSIANYLSLDPTTGMLVGFMDDYNIRGGIIKYNSASIDATGLSLSYKMTSNTILDGIKAMLDLSPDGFYWYVEMGSNTLYFKNASTTPDLYLIKGKHMNTFGLTASIENVVNDELFSGGDTGGGVNLFKEYQDSASQALYGRRLTRKSDNRVTVTATADAIGTSDIARQKDEQFQTVIKLSDGRNLDTASLHVGLIVGLRAFGTFVDSITMQIVRIDYAPDEVTLTLGEVPKRMSVHTERITRELIALQTIDNPANPS